MATFSRLLEPSGGLAGPRLNVVAIAVLLGAFAVGALGQVVTGSPVPLVASVLVGVVLMQAPRVAQQWERAIVLRLGRFVGLRGPGLFWIVPFIDSVSSWIDQRTITTNFAAEQTLTSDTVPVSVDAVLFWMVHDAQKAALEVQEYAQAVSWAAQTALRDIIGRTALTDLLRGRYGFKGMILSDWGITNDCDSNCLNGFPAGTRPSFRGFGTPWGLERASIAERFRRAIEAGMDQFGGSEDTHVIAQLVKSESIPEQRLNESAERILIQKFELGLFDNPFVETTGIAAYVGTGVEPVHSPGPRW